MKKLKGWRRWTKEETDLIKVKYPSLGTIGLVNYIDRSRHSIVDKAHRLKIKWDTPARKRTYCKHCGKELINHINIKGTIREYCSRANSCRSCSSKIAFNNGVGFISHPTNKKWTKEDIEILKKLYPNSKQTRLFNKLNRNWSSIQHKARRLEIKRNKRFMIKGNKLGRRFFKEKNPMGNTEIRKKVSIILKEGYKNGKYKVGGIAKQSMLGLIKKENHPNWLGGISFEPYDKNWDDDFKREIKERDNYTCQLCKRQNQLCVHHIDYNKKNTIKTNCITLCFGCNAKVNFSRLFWEYYFNNIISIKKLTRNMV